MLPIRKTSARPARGAALGLAVAGAVALATAIATVPAALGAQQGTAPATPRTAPSADRRGFELFAVVDFAATGVRANGSPYRFFVTNAGPMDLNGVSTTRIGVPSAVVRSNGTFTQFSELTLFATTAPGDRARNAASVPSLANATGGGAALSFSFHKEQGLQVSNWSAADASLGFLHSGVRSTAAGCTSHGVNLTVGIPLMAGSDCRETWGLSGFQGRRPITPLTYSQIFRSAPASFQFNFFDVPATLTDTFNFLGDRFQTFGVASDYTRERLLRFGNVIPGGQGAPQDQGYPLGLEWRFDAFTFSAAPGVVFWQGTVTNKSADVYGTGLNYDSLIVGVAARHGRTLRSRAGFDPARGIAVFDEIGHNGNCDNALPVPGGFASDNFFGDCRAPQTGFTNGAAAIVVLKSPIGDLRYKQFTDPTSAFYDPTNARRGDTITYNIGRMCGDECTAERMAASPTRGFGVLAAREGLALGGESPSSLNTLQYWHLFHPANGAADNRGPRVDLTNPRGGGGFNFTTLPGWNYERSPGVRGGAATGDTLFYDTCNPTLTPTAVPTLVPQTATTVGRCTGRWIDTLPDRTLNFTRATTWIGAGPFKLAAGQTTSFVMAIATAIDSATIEANINGAISIYQSFYVTAAPLPAPRITSVQVAPGGIRQTNVRIFFENRAQQFIDPFVLQLSERFRVDTLASSTSQFARLNRLNRRIIRPNITGDTGLRIADTLRILASRQLVGYYVYKSCEPGSGRYTKSASPFICSNDRIFDSLGVDRGPAAYAPVGLLPDSANQFADGNVLGGRPYQYTIVPVSRGVRLQLVADSTTLGRRVIDTTLIAPRSELPALQSAPNVATVYVPASLQAGGARSRVQYVSETGPRTTDGDSTSFNGPFITVNDTLSARQDYRLVIGDTVVIREYSTNTILDSTTVTVFRSAPVGFTFSRALSTTGNAPLDSIAQFSSFATPVRRPLDTLTFIRRGGVRIAQSIVGNPVTADTGTTSLGGGRTVFRQTLRNRGGFRIPADTIVNAGAPTAPRIVGGLPQAVLLRKEGANLVPVIVGNDLRNGTFGLNARVLASLDYLDVNVNPANRPVITTFVANASGVGYGGAQVLERFWTDPVGGRFTAVVPANPTVALQTTLTRFIGTSTGEFVFHWRDADWGPASPFNLNGGLAGLQSTLDASLRARAVASETQATDAVAKAINASLGTNYTADSLLAAKLPFKITNNSVNREAGGREVIAAMKKTDKYYASYPAGPVDVNRYLQFGTGLDTMRVFVPQDIWVPGEPLILLERVQVADTAPGGIVRKDANGNPLLRDTLLVIASRANIGCRATLPAFCNPISGRGGIGYTPTEAGQDYYVRVGVPYTADRDLSFAVTPYMAGERVQAVSRAQLDSVKVVPNPYILYSAYEYTRSNEQRVMFTHLPPEGVIRIYTAAGQFVQQLTWTPALLNGSGDLYFNLLTREGTLMAAGLYVFTVEARGSAGGARRKQVGRFIIIR